MPMDAYEFERCHCTGVGRAAVDLAVRNGCRTVEDIQRVTGACTGCRTCRPELERLLAESALAELERTPVDRVRP